MKKKSQNSLPSLNAEPFKLWLARMGYERLKEAEDMMASLTFRRVLSILKIYHLNINTFKYE